MRGKRLHCILSGEIIAGRYVERAAKRHLDDLEHAHERGLASSDPADPLNEL